MAFPVITVSPFQQLMNGRRVFASYETFQIFESANKDFGAHILNLPALCMGIAFLLSFANVYGQTAVSQKDQGGTISPPPAPLTDDPGEIANRQPSILVAFKTDRAGAPRPRAEPDPHPFDWNSPNGHFDSGAG